MGLFTSKEFTSLDGLFVDQLEDLYDAEKRLQKALPEMSAAAHSPNLKAAFDHHLKETDNHVSRLEKIFQLLNKSPKRETCDAMKGLISEGDTIVKATGDADVKDAALIAAAQRVEHYEMAGYGTARTFALRLGHSLAAELLEQTLEEEKHADSKLNEIAEEEVNAKAQTA